MLQINNKRITRLTIAYLLILSGLIWILFFNTIQTPDQLWGFIPGFKLNQLFIPLVSGVTLIYASYMTPLLTVGRLTKPIQKTLQVSSITLPLALTSNWPQTPYYLHSLMRLPLVISTILSVLNIVQKYMNENNDYSSIYKGVRIGVIGLAVYPVYHNTLTELRSLSLTGVSLPIPVELLNNNILDSVGLAFRTACLLSLGISLLSILSKTKNPYLSYVGKVSDKKIYTKLALLLLFAVYFQIGRTIIIGTSWIDWQLLITIEWLVITLSFYLGYRSISQYAETLVKENAEIDDWSKHIQQIEYTSDKKHKELTRLITSFVENAEKSRLITILANLMTKSGYETEKTHHILQSLIEYAEPASSPLLFRWQLNQHITQNQNQRKLLIKEVFDMVDSADIVISKDQTNEETEVIN